jgi:hypothetical protein
MKTKPKLQCNYCTNRQVLESHLLRDKRARLVDVTGHEKKDLVMLKY